MAVHELPVQPNQLGITDGGDRLASGGFTQYRVLADACATTQLGAAHRIAAGIGDAGTKATADEQVHSVSGVSLPVEFLATSEAEPADGLLRVMHFICVTVGEPLLQDAAELHAREGARGVGSWRV